MTITTPTDDDLIRRGDAADIALEADLGWHDGVSGDWHPFSAKDVCNHIAAKIGKATPADAQAALARIRAEAREAALREALTAIAALPLGDGPGIDEGHEQAYRTIEALIGGAA